MSQTHGALWADMEVKKKMAIKIKQLGYERQTHFFEKLVEKTNKELEEFLREE